MRPLGWKSPKDTLHDFIKHGVTYVWQTNTNLEVWKQEWVARDWGLGVSGDWNGSSWNRHHLYSLYSAVLRSFDSVLIFYISHFLTYDAFLRSGWRNALRHNLEPGNLKFESRDWELVLRLVPLPMYRQPERSLRSFLHPGKKSVRDSRKTQNKNVVDEMAHTCWFTYCSRDLSATLEMTTTWSVIKILRRLDPSTQFSYSILAIF